MEKLNRAQKYSILGPQNLGSRGGGRAPLDPHLERQRSHQHTLHTNTDSCTLSCLSRRIGILGGF